MKNYEFGNYLCELRRNSKISQRILARELGLSDKTVSKWENGTAMPKSSDLIRIARFFGISVDKLLSCGADNGNQNAAASVISPFEISKGCDHVKESENRQLLENLISPAGKTTGNYMCTFHQQAVVAKKLGLKGRKASHLRDALNSETLFGEENYYHPISRELRSNLIFLLDDGWDVPYGTPNDPDHLAMFGSVEPDEEKFAEFGNTALERLCGISKKVKELGYAGLGLWIAPQQVGETEYDPYAARLYWEERAKMSQQAGVLYWKVDWGMHASDVEYHRMISEAMQKYAPDVMVEHSVGELPYTQLHEEGFVAIRQAKVKKQMAFCDAYRTYDISQPFDDVCTLQRSSEALAQTDISNPKGLGLVNAEGQSYIAAALGLTIGIMLYDKETQACLNWHRLAPPFSVHGSTFVCSEQLLEDSMFMDTEPVRWLRCAGRFLTETAPAIMARNCPLPEVKKLGEHQPFVAAAKNPVTSAYSIATFRRTIDPNPKMICLADVTAHEVDICASIGVFGYFNSLTLEFTTAIPENCRILVQDLIAETPMDVTDQVKIDGSKLMLDGKLLRYWGKSGRGDQDTSDPSLVMKLSF